MEVLVVLFSLCRNEYALMEDNLREFQDLRRVDDGLKSSLVEMGPGVVGSGGGDEQEMEQDGSEGQTAGTHVCDPLLEATTRYVYHCHSTTVTAVTKIHYTWFLHVSFSC